VEHSSVRELEVIKLLNQELQFKLSTAHERQKDFDFKELKYGKETQRLEERIS
jgi:hypothetical protein